MTDVARTAGGDAALDPARLQALLDGAPLPLAVWKDGSGLYANDAFRRLFAVPQGESLVGKPVFSVIAPEDRAAVQERLDRRRRGEVVDGSYPFHALRFDGSRFRARVQLRQVELPEGPVSISFIEDMSELRRAEQELRDSQEMIRLAMRGARMGAWSRDLADNSVEWTPELEMIFGLPAGSFRGSESAFFEFVHPDDRVAVADAVTQALRNGSDYVVEFRFSHASGEWRWMEGRGRAIYGPAGEPLRLYGIGIDVTERRNLEDALREADRRKDEFLATLAHELRNPLAPLVNAAQILANPQATRAQTDWSREVIVRQVRHMARLLDDLLDVGRIARGKLELRRERIGIATALQLALETARPLLTARGHELAVDIAPETPDVLADPVRIAQILGNLLTNAAKYTPAGGHIRITAAPEGGQVLIRIRDDGIGITADALPRIFDLFTRAVNPEDSTEGGLGVGLAITRQLVELHGGTLSAHSEGRGRGSEFAVRLDALDPLRERLRV